jgi:hypothetical protein
MAEAKTPLSFVGMSTNCGKIANARRAIAQVVVRRFMSARFRARMATFLRG